MKTVRILCQECFKRTGSVLAEPSAAQPEPSDAPPNREEEILLAITRAGLTLVQTGKKFRLERYHEVKPQTPGMEQGDVWRAEGALPLAALSSSEDQMHSSKARNP